ncbi:DUF6817 domain-containing protein [Streptomyces melanogenes]|uniref:DUF6817 domain-containing protein n=1 Tax=Streptomyces melanogenes TaxID=67326 RepID=A0ABZ1XCY9_9ACTN|nr:hypothetical protein [Streptomyces melanogenes]
MTDGPGTAPEWSRAEAFLRGRGAARMPHPGGTLLEHLGRVRGLLAEWGADSRIQAAGLCHATYGTDGFDEPLLPVTERAVLAELIGERAEELVYLYASCDRGVVYPQLGGVEPVAFRDRFTGARHTPDEADLRAFVEITAANELDVMAHNAELAERHGAQLHRLFTRSGGLLSRAAQDACARQLGP